MLVENDKQIQSGLCLISIYENDLIGLARIDFPSEDDTIGEYKDWLKKNTDNIISLSKPSYPPQRVLNEDIDDVRSFAFIAKFALDDMDHDRPLFPTEFYFSELLERLWSVNSIYIADYEKVVTEYYTDIYGG